MNNKYRYSLSVVLAAMYIVSVSPHATATTPMHKLDGIVAFVGDSIILSSELEAYILMKNGGIADTVSDSLAKTMMRHEALNELVEGKVLLVKAARDTNITITENEIDAELNSRIQSIIKQNNLTPEQFESVLRNQQGITLAKFKEEVRKQIRQELLKQKVQQLYVGGGSIDRSEVEKFYQEYKDSLPVAGKSILLSIIQIRVSVSDKIRQDAYAKIKAIKERLDNGEDFSQAAKQYSEDPTAAQGGDLGFVGKGTLNELAFEEKAFSTGIGEISDIFETRLGFHIITVVAKKDNMVHVKQIFVPIMPPAEMITGTKGTLDSVRQAAKTPQDFLSSVRALSTDKISKSRDGLLGWQELSALDPALRAAVDSLAVGAISPVLQTENTLTIYRCENRKDSRTLTLDEDWGEIATIAQRIYSQKKLLALVKKWRQQTFIDIRL